MCPSHWICTEVRLQKYQRKSVTRIILHFFFGCLNIYRDMYVQKKEYRSIKARVYKGPSFIFFLLPSAEAGDGAPRKSLGRWPFSALIWQHVELRRASARPILQRTRCGRIAQALSLLRIRRCSIYLLYWYKSTRFPGTKVQILTPEALVWRDMSLLVEKAVTRRLLKEKLLAVSA